MLDIESIIGLITGEAGALVVLILIVWALVFNKLFTSTYVNDLKDTNDRLTQTLEKQGESLDSLATTAEANLENSRTTLKAIQGLREESGIHGDLLDKGGDGREH